MTEIKYQGFRGKKIAIFGLGKSGIAAAELLLQMGATIYAWDDKPDSCKKFADAMIGKGSVTVAPPETYMWGGISVLVLSPGVPLTHPKPHPIVEMAKKVSAEIICDVEILYRAAPEAKYIGITGTNGKSTTTALIGHILKQAGKKVEVGGNIGRAAGSMPLLGSDGRYVLELSSYQLELVNNLHINISILLNITPDHIDRHGNMQGYINAKKHIFDRTNSNDFAIFGQDSADSAALYEELKNSFKGKLIPISGYKSVDNGIYADEFSITDSIEKPIKINLPPLAQLPGKHNRQNIAASFAACKAAGLSNEEIIAGIKTFTALDHRLQNVGSWQGVEFVNDSKATNGMASSHALASFPEIYWIAGGMPKDDGLEPVMPYINNVKKAYLIGQAAEEFSKVLAPRVPYEINVTIEKAFAAAAKDAAEAAKKGGNPVVLLSPACASFDQFQNFEHRGKVFADLAANLNKQEVA